MRSGIRALVSLDGAPHSERDLATMWLTDSVLADGLAACAKDLQADAIDVHRTPEAVTLFAGYLDEQEHLAGQMGLAANTPPAALAAAAIARFGKEGPAHMLGEWSVLHWHARTRELILVAAEGIRDRMYVAAGSGLVAIGPSAMQLGRLGWVGLALDPAGFCLNNSRAGLRHIRTSETMWRGIQLLEPGSTETFRQGKRTSVRVSPGTQFPRWPGSFDEAAEALDEVGRHIIGQHMKRHPSAAFLLSGGLDSTLLNAWGACERGPGRTFFAVSSVAPPGSGQTDESRWIDAAADALGIDSRKAWPRREDNLFQPPAEAMRDAEGIVSGPYNVNLALQAVALAGGATALVDGSAGEMHLSKGLDIPETRSWVRLQIAYARDEIVRRQRFSGWPAAAFHVRLHPELMSTLPRDWARVWRKGVPRDPKPGRNDPPMGIDRMAHKLASTSTASSKGLRLVLPYRDQRLMRLAARMPVSFLGHQGLTRPLARRLLLGRVPDVVRLRESFMPFSPDYVPRLQRQATGVHARIPLYREAGAGRWLDLDWLSESLVRLAATRAERDYLLYFEVHTTASAGEFLLWARGEGVGF